MTSLCLSVSAWFVAASPSLSDLLVLIETARVITLIAIMVEEWYLKERTEAAHMCLKWIHMHVFMMSIHDRACTCAKDASLLARQLSVIFLAVFCRYRDVGLCATAHSVEFSAQDGGGAV